MSESEVAEGLKQDYRTYLEKMRGWDFMGARMCVTRAGERLRDPAARGAKWRAGQKAKWTMLHEVLGALEEKRRRNVG